MQFTKFGGKLKNKSGISLLMEDLGHAMNVNKDILMLGGGNPAFIPELQAEFRKSMAGLLENGKDFDHAVGVYDTPQGNHAFIAALCKLMNDQFSWGIGPENIALTTGSQSAFYVLFNMFAGLDDNGVQKKILLPMAPEYIGYSDVGLEGDIFRSYQPNIEMLDNRMFKYRVDFEQLKVTDDIGAICVSRPTNPTGNVITDSEVSRLMKMAKQSNVPLILDNAYGTPFPNIIFSDAKPFWGDNVIVCMSLSKFGLPGTRTGIIIASPEIIQAVSEFNAVLSLAPGGMGAAIATPLLESGRVLELSRNVIAPFYDQRCKQALKWIHEYFDGLEYYVHKPEGALFLWLWFKGMSISDNELYQRLKNRGVLVVPGFYFFPGINDDWQHKNECIRMTYSQEPAAVEAGIKLMAEELQNLN